MEEICNIKNVCGFYISSTHLITMILPYIRQQLSKNMEIETVLGYNLKETVNKVLTNLIIKDEEKEKISNINWKDTKLQKYSNIEKMIKNKLEINRELNILISGNKEYIDKANKIINKILDKNINKIKGKEITVINCYEVTEFNDNIREVLNEHEFMINTSGMHRIEEIFGNYRRKAN